MAEKILKLGSLQKAITSAHCGITITTEYLKTTTLMDFVLLMSSNDIRFIYKSEKQDACSIA